MIDKSDGHACDVIVQESLRSIVLKRSDPGWKLGLVSDSIERFRSALGVEIDGLLLRCEHRASAIGGQSRAVLDGKWASIIGPCDFEDISESFFQL